MSIVGEAIKGIQIDVNSQTSMGAKFQRFRKLYGILLSEIVGILALIPTGVANMMMYRSIIDLDTYLKNGRKGATKGVVVKRDIAYGPGERERMDVYIPEGAVQGKGTPTVMYIHGGVWASGEKWHYAPMGIRLAQAGLIVAIPSYTLYPEAKGPQMVKEMSDALGWLFDNVAELGGDVDNLTLTGHSAGGHLAAMVMLCRALATSIKAGEVPATLPPSPPNDSSSTSHANLDDPATAAAELAATGSAHEGSLKEEAGYLHGAGSSFKDVVHSMAAVTASQGPEDLMTADANLRSLGITDSRMPARFLGMAGVYDIGKHYEFERSRHVHEMSMMKRAMSGIACFASMSPSVILGVTAAVAATKEAKPPPPSSNATSATDPNYFSSFHLWGEAISTRAGLSDAPRDGTAHVMHHRDGTAHVPASIPEPDFPMEAAKYLPPSYVMSSCADYMVPWHEGAELVAALQKVGNPARHCIYNHTLHSDYVTAWQPLPNSEAKPPANEWAPHQRDFVLIAKGEAERSGTAAAVQDAQGSAATAGGPRVSMAAIRGSPFSRSTFSQTGHHTQLRRAGMATHLPTPIRRGMRGVGAPRSMRCVCRV